MSNFSDYLCDVAKKILKSILLNLGIQSNEEGATMCDYFAYGSNMDQNHVNDWCLKKGYERIKFLSLQPAKLESYKLEFNYFSEINWKAGAANIMGSPGCAVYGFLVKLSPDDLDKIRKKEGSSKCYEEILVTVKLLSNNKSIHHVKTYKAVKNRECNDFQPPKREYLNLIIGCAEEHNFPEDYREHLRSIQTAD